MFFIPAKTNAQFDFIPDNNMDTSFYSDQRETLSEIDSAFHLMESDFELRVWTDYAPFRSRSLFLLAQHKGTWFARHFVRYFHPDTGWEERQINDTALSKLFSRLKSKKVLTLPGQDSVKRKYNYEELDLRDGVSYVFEIKYLDKKRFYRYSNPQAYGEEYTQIKEFKWVNENINAIRTFCDLKKIPVK